MFAFALGLAELAPTLAHPLGNISISVYERIEISAGAIAIHLVVDMSEFPALFEQAFADTNADGDVDEQESTAYLDGLWNELQAWLTLTVDGQRAPIERVGQELTFPDGQGGLPLLRAEFELVSLQPTQSRGDVVDASFTEAAFEGTPGWHEMIVVGGPGVTLRRSSVPDTDLTNELTSYPEDLLDSPLIVREATFRYRVDEQPPPSVAPPTPPATTAPATTPPATTAPATTPPASAAPPTTPPPPVTPTDGPRPTDPLIGLLGNRLDLISSFAGLLLAAVLGASHAITPGHGKTLVAAYLVGSRANISHGFWLGGTVAITHTGGIFLLGLATLAFTEWIVPQQIVGWLTVATGLLIVLMGAFLVWRAQQLRSVPGAQEHVHEPGHGHGHDHDHVGAHAHHSDRDADQHEHVATTRLRRRDVAVLGVVGGLVPSGSALLLLLGSIALNEVAYGLMLIVAFGLGMAAVLIGLTIGIVFLRRTPVLYWERWRNPRLRAIAVWLPTSSGLLVVVLGLLFTWDALRNLP